MSPGRRRFSSMIVFTIMVLLVVSISSAVYFFKIQKNEDYQNQLLFREINTVAHTVETSVAQFARIGRIITNLMSQGGEAADEQLNVINRARNTPALANLTTTQASCRSPSRYVPSARPCNIGSIVTRGDKVVFVGKLVENNDASHHAVEVPTSDLLPTSLMSLPIVMLADKKGALIAKKVYLENSTYAADLEFQSVSDLLKELQVSQSGDDDEANMPSYSGTLDKQIAGITYRIFMQPITLHMGNQNHETHYLIGLVPFTDLQIAKLSVSPGSGLWIFIALLVLSAVIPILKIRFSSSRTHFTKTDISLFFTGSILLLGIVTITVNHQLFFTQLMGAKQKQAESLLAEFKQELSDEIDAINKVRQSVGKQIDIDLETLVTGSEGSCAVTGGIGDYAFECPQLDLKMVKVNASNVRGMGEAKVWSVNQLSNGLSYDYPNYLSGQITDSLFTESAFKLNYKGVIALADQSSSGGEIPIRLPIMRISPSAYNFTDFSLNHREYYQRAVSCQVWMTEQQCSSGLFIQRIKNVSDGRLSTQFAYSDFDKLHTQPLEQRRVLSLSVKLNTFFERIMPLGYGFAVFDDKGNVLYHSDESRALLENILVETNNDEHLQTLLGHHGYSASNTISFSTTYRNAEHMFVASNVSNQIPWHLVVFYDTDSLSEYNLWMLLVAVVLFVKLMLVLLLWNRFITKQLIWSRILSFHKGDSFIDADSSVSGATKSAQSPYRMRYGATATLIFSITFAMLLLLGVLVDLSVRFAVWSLAAVFILLLLSHKVKVNPSRVVCWSHPVMSFLIMFLVYATITFYGFSDNAVQWQSQTSLFANMAIFLVIAGVTFYMLCRNKAFVRYWMTTPFYKAYAHISAHPYFHPSSQSTRYSKSYVAYIVSLLWFFAVVPAAMLINASNHYLLDFQAHQESAHIEQRIDDYEKARLGYLNLMRPERNNVVNLEHKNVFNALFQINNGNEWISLAEAQTESDERHDASLLAVDVIINQLVSLQAFGASLNQSLFQFAQLESKYTHITYDGNLFLWQAVEDNWLLVFISMLVTIVFTFAFARAYIVQLVMGEHIPDNFRLPGGGEQRDWQSRLAEIASTSTRFRAQIMRTNHDKAIARIKSATGLPVFEDRVIEIGESLERSLQAFSLVNQLSRATSSVQRLSIDEAQDQSIVLVLKGLEALAFKANERLLAQELIMQLHQLPNVNIVFLCEVAPLFRLCQQDAYPNVASSEYASADEALGWATLMADYTKLYDWIPPVKSRLSINASAIEVLDYESQGWFQLYSVESLFRRMYAEHLDNIEQNWRHDQIIEFFCSHAGAIYRHKWLQCTKNERVLLFQLAGGATLNANNIETLEQLMRRGYIYRDCGWFIVNESFRRFVLHAESEATFAEWLSDVSMSSWQYIRIPVLVTIMVLAIMIVVSTGQSLQSIIAAATASLGLVPSLMRNLSLIKGAAGTSNE